MTDTFRSRDADGDWLEVSPVTLPSLDYPAGTLVFSASCSPYLKPADVDELKAYLRNFGTGAVDKSILDTKRIAAVTTARDMLVPEADFVAIIALAAFILGELPLVEEKAS